MFILDSNLAHRPKPKGTFTNPDLVLHPPTLYIEWDRVWLGDIHFMNGRWMTGYTHTESSVYLFEDPESDLDLPSSRYKRVVREDY